MFTFLSHLHTFLRESRLNRRGAPRERSELSLGEHKKYERMEQFALPDTALDTSLGEALRSRRSMAASSTPRSVTIDEYGGLFSTLRRHAGGVRRMYPSGGALFPVETYLIETTLSGGGIFHYNPSTHALEKLWNLPEDFNIKRLAVHPESLQASAIIVFTSLWERSAIKYGHLSYQHALLETGHMSQNVLLAASALSVAARPYAGFSDALIAELLDIDVTREQPVHTILLCGVQKIERAEPYHE